MFDNGEAVPHHCLTVPKDRHLAGRRGEFVPLTAFVPILIIKGTDSLFEQQSRLLACQPTAQGPRSEERSGGKECVSKCRARRSPEHEKNKHYKTILILKK